MKNGIKALAIVVATIFSTFNAYGQTKWYQDSDADTWGNPTVSQISSTQPTGYVQNNLDCNDNKFNDSKWYYVDTPAFSRNGSSVAYVSFAKDKNDIFYVAFYDNTTKKGSVMKYSNNKWVYVGSPNFTTSDAEYISIDVDRSGTPYVAYQDKSYNYQATVKKFDGTSWVTVGYPGFSSSTSKINTTVIKLDQNDIPYVMYQQPCTNQSCITVKKFNGTTWITVGANNFTTSDAQSRSFVFDKNNIPHLALRSYNKAIVLKYNGTYWDTLGNPEFSAGGIWDPAIAFDNNNVPYVAYADWNQGNRVTVMKLNGNTWQQVGSAGFSTGYADYLSIIVDKTNTPIVAYRRQASVVRKYNGSNWQIVGNGNFSIDWSRYISILLDSNDIPYVAFEDWENDGELSVMRLQADSLGAPDTPIASANKVIISQGDTTILSVDTGVLNDASSWVWYTGSCGGTKVTPVSTNTDGSQITVAPNQTTTYYVRGEGQCVADGVCDSVIITVPVSVVNKDKSTPFNFYPNPATTHIVLNGIKSAATVNIYDVVGRTMLTTTINNTDNTSIDVSTLPRGCYAVELSFPNGIKHISQLIKQ